MIAICDCNYFYAACEMLVRPELWDKPVIVLSNNEGVIVTLNPKAKKIGLKRGMNFYEIQYLIKKHDVRWFPSNYELYGDISDNVMIAFSQLVELMEVNSIDEAWLSLKGYERYGYEAYSRHIIETVKERTGIAVSIGCAQTKTLAKICNGYAKKFPEYGGVFVMDSEFKRIQCLKETAISDVWEIGDGIDARLNKEGVFTAYDFITKISQSQARKILSVKLERTWCELQGIVCYPVDPKAKPKKTIRTSRSFAKTVNNIHKLKQAVSSYAAICAQNLRNEKAFALQMKVFLKTNRFKLNQPQYNPERIIKLPLPANTGGTLIKYALQAVEDMFLDGFEFKSAGVEITKLTDKVQTCVFMPYEEEVKRSKASPVEDFNSHGFDRKALHYAVEDYLHREGIDLKTSVTPLNATTQFKHFVRINCRKEVV